MGIDKEPGWCMAMAVRGYHMSQEEKEELERYQRMREQENDAVLNDYLQKIKNAKSDKEIKDVISDIISDWY